MCWVIDIFHTQLYTNVKCFSLWQNTTCKTHALQHCQHDHDNPFSSSDSCVRYQTLVLTGDSSYVLGNVSSPFQYKERFCDTVSFGIIPSSVQKCRVLFSNYFVFAKLSRWKPMDLLSRLIISSPMKENKKFTNVFTRNISELAALKLVMS